jgi:polyadenylation factor subunit 2
MIPTMEKVKVTMYDPNIAYANYLNIRMYDFYFDYTNNPLLPVYPVDKSDINIPDSKYTNERLDICNKLIALCPNLVDRKPINCCKIFNYSKKIVSGTSTGNLIIYDILSQNINFTNRIQAHSSSIRAIQFTKTESHLLTGDNTGNIIYFDNVFNQKSKLKAHNDKEAVTDINFSISNTKFITSSDDKTSKIFDLNTGLEEIVFTEHGSDVKSCDWNPYKNLVCSGGKDQLLKIWDPRSGEVISTLHPHKNTINRLRFNKNGNWLLSASKDHSLKVIDIRVMKEMQIFRGHEMEVNTISWHPSIEELFCSAGADGSIIYWLLGQNKNYIMKGSHDKEIFDLSFNSTGSLLASGSNDSTIKFWMRKFEYY